MTSAPPAICDTHAHFDTFEEVGTTDAVLDRARDAGVTRIIAIGGTGAANGRAVALAKRHAAAVRATVGFDRDEVARARDWMEAERLLADPSVVAVGEAGLDYHYSPETAAQQRALFAENLERALAFRKPIVIHSREADDDTVAMLAGYAKAWTGPAGLHGVLHCFTGSVAFARRVLDAGFFISFSGIVTFKNAESLREVARFVPLDRMLAETDAPYLAPVPHRGKPNEPAWVAYVVAALASSRGAALQDVSRRLWANAMNLFRWETDGV